MASKEKSLFNRKNGEGTLLVGPRGVGVSLVSKSMLETENCDCLLGADNTAIVSYSYGTFIGGTRPLVHIARNRENLMTLRPDGSFEITDHRPYERPTLITRVIFLTHDGSQLDSRQDIIDEIGKIFRGEITNWSEVGGPDMSITLYGRQSNSGTFVFFRDAILKGDYSQKMNRMNGNAQIVEGVRNDKSAIGYVGVGYVKEAKGLTVLKVASRAGADYASPLNSSDVKSGKYPISRPLNQYINGMPTGDTKAFLEFEVSDRSRSSACEARKGL